MPGNSIIGKIMKLQVICQDCGKMLCEIEKDQINQEDLDLYSNNVSCQEDPQSEVAAVKVLK